MTRRRTDKSRRNPAFNDRAERKRGLQVTVEQNGRVVFKGRLAGFVTWRHSPAGQKVVGA